MKPQRLTAGLLGMALLFAVTACETSVSLSPGADQSMIPRPSKTGPHPKVVLAGPSEFDFGLMEQGEQDEHIFTLRNEGEAVLVLAANIRKLDNTCQCTVGKLFKGEIDPNPGEMARDDKKSETAIPQRIEVAPGETASVKVMWLIKKPEPGFHNTATITTNDPEHLKLPFVIKGTIGRRMVMKPGNTWSLGHLTSNKPVEFSLSLHSETVDSFKILKIDTDSKLVSTRLIPLDAAGLGAMVERAVPSGQEETSQKTSSQASLPKPARAKSGYKVIGTFTPDIPPGPFRISLTFHTDLDERHSVLFTLNGSRSGPIEFMPSPGADWSSEHVLLRLGLFSARKGKHVLVPMLIKDTRPDTTLEVVRTDPEYLDVEFEHDTDFKGQSNQRYRMSLTIPKGKPPRVCIGKNRGEVELKTSDGKTLRFYIGYISAR